MRLSVSSWSSHVFYRIGNFTPNLEGDEQYQIPPSVKLVMDRLIAATLTSSMGKQILIQRSSLWPESRNHSSLGNNTLTSYISCFIIHSQNMVERKSFFCQVGSLCQKSPAVQGATNYSRKYRESLEGHSCWALLCIRDSWLNQIWIWNSAGLSHCFHCSL